MKSSVFNAGSVFAAFLASACCILPLVLSVLGLGGLAFAAKLEPYRPYFIGITVIFLGAGFYYTYRPEQQECAPGEACAVPSNKRVQKIALWTVAILTALLVAFPYLLPLLPI
ncbi:MAG: mercuric transport protein [Calditrichaeota bacterium]|nr:MAG: mercuric transport protein [Calditrichota bacterium]